MEQEQNKVVKLTKEQADIIGEVSNISMGSAATALSSLLGRKVVITSPEVREVTRKSIADLEEIPSIGVIISYTAGVKGSDFLLMRNKDVLEVVNIMMGGDQPDEEMGELHLSAIAEVMNQMMGSSATALSSFVGKPVNISPPSAFIITEENKNSVPDFLNYEEENVVLVRFKFEVEGVFVSEFFVIMTYDFSLELVNAMMANAEQEIGDKQEEPASPPPQQQEAPKQEVPPVQNTYAQAPPPQAPQYMQPPVSYPNPAPQYAQYPQYPEYPQYPQQPMQPVQQVDTMKAVRPLQLKSFDKPALSTSEASNFELIQDVPLDVSVEVGRARRPVREIIDFSVGSIIELDKQAGDPVDVIVNGQLIAHGEVVVIDESFGVRITEIVNQRVRNN